MRSTQECQVWTMVRCSDRRGWLRCSMTSTPLSTYNVYAHSVHSIPVRPVFSVRNLVCRAPCCVSASSSLRSRSTSRHLRSIPHALAHVHESRHPPIRESQTRGRQRTATWGVGRQRKKNSRTTYIVGKTNKKHGRSIYQIYEHVRKQARSMM